MNTIIKKSLQSVLLVPAIALGVSALVPVAQPASVSAQCGDVTTGGISGGANCAKGEGQEEGDLFGEGSIFNTIVNTFLFILGAIAVIMLVYGGFRYVTSGGDATAVTAAKNTILYAIVGIVVAILAYAIVQFAVGAFTGGTTGASA